MDGLTMVDKRVILNDLKSMLQQRYPGAVKNVVLFGRQPVFINALKNGIYA